jgi:ATP-dependent DNA helicase RecQ
VQDIHGILKQYWGFDKFRPLQEEIIRSVLAKNDTLALMPTGGGKSLCFQLPALVNDGMCLVISPLIALMKDQVQQLEAKGIKALAIYSGLDYRTIDSLLDRCVYGNYKFLYISPERLQMEDLQGRIEKMNISLLAVDEAHCISQWGYDFRPTYLRIAEVREKLKNVPLIALTATATPEVVEDIQKQLLFKSKNVFQKSFTRKNLSYVVRKTSDKNRSALEILNKVNGSAIIYFRSRKKTQQFSDYLNKHNIQSDYYHAGLLPQERSLKQDNWVKNKCRVICCTNAFGMGIDKPDVRLVMHLDLAESIEAYYQEAGRAGRDEQKAYAVQLLTEADIFDLDRKIVEGYPDIDFIKNIYDSLCKYLRVAYENGENQSFDFDARNFAHSIKTDAFKIYAVLKILEQQKLIYLSDGAYSLSQVKAIAQKDHMFDFQSKNKKYEPLVKFILRTSEGVFEDYVNVEEEVIAARLKLSVGEVIEQLKALDVFKIFIYKPRSEKPQITLLQNRKRKEDLRLDREFLKRRETSLINRLNSVKYYVTENNICRSRLLVKYFGENNDENCGICDVCLAGKKAPLAATEFEQITLMVQTALTESPLTLEQLKNKVSVNSSELNRALDFLMDAGKIKRTARATLQWIA